MKLAPFYLAEYPPEARDPASIQARYGCSAEHAHAFVESLKHETVYRSTEFQVAVRNVGPAFGDEIGDVLWLSIKRIDRDPIHDWRALQAIKNAIVGAEHEGFEMYPAESRLVDEANQYHLWVFADAAVRLPLGFATRSVGTPDTAAAVGAKQRPHDDADPTITSQP